MNAPAVISIIVLVFVYIGRPFLNVKVDLFNQEAGGGNVSRHGNFITITECQESENISGVVANDDRLGGVGDETTEIDMDCKDIVHDILALVILAVNYFIILSGCVHVFLSAAWLGKRTNIESVVLAKHAALGFFVECIMFVCYISFATLVGQSVGFTASDLTAYFYAMTVLTACLITLTFCTLIISGMKILQSNKDTDKDTDVKPFMKLYSI